MVEAEPPEEKDAAEDQEGYPYPYELPPDKGSEETREIVNKERMTHRLFPRNRPAASRPL